MTARVHLSQVVLYSFCTVCSTASLTLTVQNVVIAVEETEGLVTLESLSDPSCHLLQTIMKGKTLIQASLYSIVSEVTHTQRFDD